MHLEIRSSIATTILLGLSALTQTAQAESPVPPDQLGMGRYIGPETWSRCSREMTNPHAKLFDLAQPRNEAMPQAKFAERETYVFDAPHGIPGTRHGFNTETVHGNIGGQGTQIDALGHFGVLPETWDGKGPFPSSDLQYYGGWKHSQVKPSPNSNLKVLGVETIPPIVTSAILLDAARFLNDGKLLNNNEIISKANIQGMLKAQGLESRGLQAGDVLFIYTGWGDQWKANPDEYYTRGPGLGYDAALYLAEMKITAVGLDNPFTDPAPEGMLTGKAQPAGTPRGLPFAIHHQNLSQSGIYQIQNAKLDELAENEVWESCVMAIPLNIQGAAQSPLRPVAIGAPVSKQKR